MGSLFEVKYKTNISLGKVNHVSLEDTVFNQDIALRGIALVVHMQGAPLPLQRSVVNHYNNSGALFICAGQPTIRVKNILVGGTE